MSCVCCVCRRRHKAVSEMRSIHRKDGRWIVQSHDVLNMWLRVLLAVHAGDI